MLRTVLPVVAGAAPVADILSVVVIYVIVVPVDVDVVVAAADAADIDGLAKIQPIDLQHVVASSH